MEDIEKAERIRAYIADMGLQRIARALSQLAQAYDKGQIDHRVMLTQTLLYLDMAEAFLEDVK